MLNLILPLLALTGAHTFEIKDHHFMLDGKPFQIVAGEIHSERIPEPYWRQRLRMARAMGLNTISVYVFWNYHEPEKGKFNFSGNGDIARFVKIAQEEGLYVMLRPGPYVCAEWEFGGLPWWLQVEPGLVVRSNNKPFLDLAVRYMKKVGEQLAPLQVARGGNIIMVQVENEYGSYGNDKQYMGAVRDMIRAAGFDVPLYTADGGSQMPAGYLPDVLPGLNGGGADTKQTIDKFARGGPYIVPEFYPGWLCHWGENFPRSNGEGVAKQFDWYLNNDVSVSIYMWHGGTNFGFWNGANFGGTYQPHITSYDYDAPLDEAGHATPKYIEMRAVAQKRFGALPPVPHSPPVISIPQFELSEFAPIPLPKPIESPDVLPMEKVGQGYGFIQYRTRLATAGKLTVSDVRDFALVMVDGRTVGTLDRRRKEKSLDVPAGQLDILVENGGRINYGREILDNMKGITHEVTLDGRRLSGWKIYRLPFDSLAGLHFSGPRISRPAARGDQAWSVEIGFGVGGGKKNPLPSPPPGGEGIETERRVSLGIEQPTFHENADTTKNLHPNPPPQVEEGTGSLRSDHPTFFRAKFLVPDPADTWLDMRGWTKGVVWVNGHNLGRYWWIGPQQTLYCPGCWLKKGENEIVVFEILGTLHRTVEGLNHPILDDLHPEPSLKPKRAQLDHDPSPQAKDLVTQGDFPDGHGTHDVKFDERSARYVCFEATSSQKGQDFASCSEFWLLGADGKPLDRSKWKVIHTDSEETLAEDGSADNLIDGDATTFWHSIWSQPHASLPHFVVIDLGGSVRFSGFRAQPRQDGESALMKGYRLYASDGPF